MKKLSALVIANTPLESGSHLLRLRCREIALHALPGQFVHVRCTPHADPLLRRPFSITHVSGADSVPDEFALLVDVVGRGSALLAASEPGKTIDLIGPLGHGFEIEATARQILLVAGGTGIAPMLFLSHRALQRDIAVTLLYGARHKGRIFPASFIPPEVEYVVLTDDGSFGRRGLVTEAMPEFWPHADQIFACGPLPMLRAVARVVKHRPLPNVSPSFVQVSLEQQMSCAVGACYGCTIDTKAGHRRVCRDGPVFDLRSIDWEGVQ